MPGWKKIEAKFLLTVLILVIGICWSPAHAYASTLSYASDITNRGSVAGLECSSSTSKTAEKRACCCPPGQCHMTDCASKATGSAAPRIARPSCGCSYREMPLTASTTSTQDLLLFDALLPTHLFQTVHYAVERPTLPTFVPGMLRSTHSRFERPPRN